MNLHLRMLPRLPELDRLGFIADGDHYFHRVLPVTIERSEVHTSAPWYVVKHDCFPVRTLTYSGTKSGRRRDFETPIAAAQAALMPRAWG
jgi:hypothetical protein